MNEWEAQHLEEVRQLLLRYPGLSNGQVSELLDLPLWNVERAVHRLATGQAKAIELRQGTKGDKGRFAWKIGGHRHAKKMLAKSGRKR